MTCDRLRDTSLVDDIACAKIIRDTPHCAVGGCGMDQWWVQNKLINNIGNCVLGVGIRSFARIISQEHRHMLQSSELVVIE